MMVLWFCVFWYLVLTSLQVPDVTIFKSLQLACVTQPVMSASLQEFFSCVINEKEKNSIYCTVNI